ncbi:hypothetical protein RYX36_030777, partial [Vicia faba]
MEIYDDEGSGCEVLINSDTKQRFTNSISSMVMHSERGFTLDREDANLATPYNMQLVKEFYFNLSNTNRKNEVM